MSNKITIIKYSRYRLYRLFIWIDSKAFPHNIELDSLILTDLYELYMDIVIANITYIFY